jgi:8-oxo-dGTP pyrophosphatase MutT (NUDIX family)
VRPGALVLAGGAGERMRSGGRPPKPLVQVRGVSLLERNVWMLIGAGIRQIWVACAAHHYAIRREVDRLAGAARPRGIAIEVLIEEAPLGTIGAAALLRGRVSCLLSVNADNVTALDLGDLLAHHLGSAADLTLASHVHVDRLPYGELCVDGQRVLAYREKPVRKIRVCSAVCVLGDAALAGIEGRTGLDELTRRLVVTGGSVRAFDHEAPWIDVNQPTDIARADALVAGDPDRFECWSPRPDLEVAGAVLVSGGRFLLEHRTAPERVWDTPGGKLEPGESAEAALVRELHEELGVIVEPGPSRARFDTLEPDGRIIRHHVFAPEVRGAEVRACDGQILAWFEPAALPAERSSVVVRSLIGAGVGEAAGVGAP